jgi:hypothetical protein
MQTLWQDLRFGARMLLKQPGFTLIAVLTLALGIGANTAIFSVVNGVLLRPLPLREPVRIVTLWENNLKDGIERDDVSPANFLAWRERSTVFETMAFANPSSFDYLDASEPETWQAALVSEGFFDILGARALVGRTLLASASSDKTLKLFELPGGREVRALAGHDEFAHSLSFSPDGTRLVSASTDQTVKLWDTQTGANVLTILYDTQVYGAIFSPDGKQMITLPMDKTVRIFHLRSEQQR